jgi:hypothetical protein
MDFPLVLKPRKSSLGRECRVITDPVTLSLVTNDLEAAGVDALLQEWIPGVRESVQIFAQDGRVVAAFAQAASRACRPVNGNYVVREGIQLPPDTRQAAEALAMATGLDGYAEVEFRRDAQGEPVLMEVNSRLCASTELAVRSGVDFPRLVFDRAAGADVSSGVGAVGDYRLGVRMRWLGGDLRWLLNCLTNVGLPDVPTRRQAVATFLAAFLHRQCYDYVDLRDLRPAARAVWELARRTATADAALVNRVTGARTNHDPVEVGEGPSAADLVVVGGDATGNGRRA